MTKFVMLSQDEISKLSTEEQAAYAKALKLFIKEYRETYPDGVTVKAALVNMGTSTFLRKNKKGELKPNVSLEIDVLDDFFKPSIGDRINRPVENVNILAKNSNFLNFAHMGMALSTFAAKGTLTLTVQLCVKGDTWKGREGASGVYTSTFLNVRDMTFAPTNAVAAYIQGAQKKAVDRGFEQILDLGWEASAAPAAAPEKEMKIPSA